MRKFLKNQKGVTMMEVLVTVALLAIVVVPCLSSFVMAQKGNVLAAQTYNEYTAAQNLMEELKGVQIPSGSDWVESVNILLESAKSNKQDGISVYETFYDDDSDGDDVKDNYCVIEIFAGEHESKPHNDEGLIVKGVIAP